MKRVLISVSDKTGIVEFATALHNMDYQIVSTGGTARILSEAGLPVTPINHVTGFPEIMNGRVKTLHPMVHGGILANRDLPEHLQEARKLGIELFDMVVVNLYPFEQTLQNPNATYADLVENIDIGGPSMLRSAAKNHAHVTIVTSSSQFEPVLAQLQEHGQTNFALRQQLAAAAFAHTARYDSLIANWMEQECDYQVPQALRVNLPLAQTLRYGENPHQQAVFCQQGTPLFSQLHGKDLSYNNYMDADAALMIIHKFMDEPAVTIVKHTNPSGIGVGDNLVEAYDKAFATDTLSPFGGIVAVSRTLDLEAAQKINTVFTELVLAPEFTEEALTFLRKKKNRRLLKYDIDQLNILANSWNWRSCAGGALMQQSDMTVDNPDDWQVVTNVKPTDEQWRALKFAWKTVATLKSNAVCFCSHDRTLGLGIGQTSRIDSTEFALQKATKFGLFVNGSVCGSDAFFPFRDSIDSLAAQGITAVIQPGGSKGDQEVIDACNEHGIAMVFTGRRHFRH